MKRFIGGLVLVIALIESHASLAAIIAYDVVKGTNCLVTQPGTTSSDVPFVGVPIGPGGSDTIVERLQDVSLGTGAPSSGTTPPRFVRY